MSEELLILISFGRKRNWICRWQQVKRICLTLVKISSQILQYYFIIPCAHYRTVVKWIFLPEKIIFWAVSIWMKTIIAFSKSIPCTVHWAYYRDQSFGQNGEIMEKKWLYCVVNSPRVSYISTKLHLVTPNGLKTEFGLFHSWPLWKSELLLFLG